ncbi:MAG: hypothetical protein CL675_01030 [Bdellovibrionaceae bacterium]|nr:hypothetical protein [Pseudobdellovibrionaceae bacterium]
MPRISFVKNHKPIDVEVGENLMATLREHDIPVASSCGGEGICNKCLIQVIEGELPVPNQREEQLQQRNKTPDGYRASCQCEVVEDITIDTPYW